MDTYLKRNWRSFCVAIIGILIASAFGVSLQFLKGDVLDAAIAGDGESALLYTSMLIGFILAEIAGYLLYDRASARFVSSCARDIKRDIFGGILNRGYVRYKELQQGEYIAKYTAEADIIKERRFAMLPRLIEILTKIAFVSVALFLLDWRVALITLFLLTTPLYLPKLIEKRLQRAQSNYVRAKNDMLASLTDWLAGFELIKNFSIERAILKRFGRLNDDVYDKTLKEARLGITARLITTLISYLSYFIILAFSAYLVLSGDFTAGSFFVAIGMIDQLSYPLISLSGIIRQLVSVRPTYRGIRQFISETDITREQAARVRLKREIRFENVGFKYDAQKPLLNGFSVVLRKGERCLLRGPSGCGKTTVTNLLLKYYEPTSGEITVDGTPIARVGDAYSLCTVVRQDAVLFRDTLRNNLTMYANIDDARLLELLKKVGLTKFANAQALDAMVEEGGNNLSGGEKKRLCLARALLRDTDVLIVDEPLANLDADTAKKIEELLLGIENRTLLIVSHQFSPENLSRLDTVKDMTPA